MQNVTLERAAFAEILLHARSVTPEECCGAVVRRDGHDTVWRFTNVQGRLHQEQPAEYPRDGTTAYTPEPKELFAALRAGEVPGARLTLFYHSHTRAGAYFSGEDRARAMFGDEPAYPDVTYLVVSDARTDAEARAFRWDEVTSDFVEVRLDLT